LGEGTLCSAQIIGRILAEKDSGERKGCIHCSEDVNCVLVASITFHTWLSNCGLPTGLSRSTVTILLLSLDVWKPVLWKRLMKSFSFFTLEGLRDTRDPNSLSKEIYLMLNCDP